MPKEMIFVKTTNDIIHVRVVKNNFNFQVAHHVDGYKTVSKTLWKERKSGRLVLLDAHGLVARMQGIEPALEMVTLSYKKGGTLSAGTKVDIAPFVLDFHDAELSAVIDLVNDEKVQSTDDLMRKDSGFTESDPIMRATVLALASKPTKGQGDSSSVADAISDSEKVKADESIRDETMRERLVDARLGQGDFRKDLRKLYGDKCPVTGIGTLDMLIASHIQPWRDCDNKERLSSANGLLLAVHIDRLFDKGYITFDTSIDNTSSGGIQISEQLPAEEREKFGIREDMKLAVSDDMLKAMDIYMDYHRRHVFKGGQK